MGDASVSEPGRVVRTNGNGDSQLHKHACWVDSRVFDIAKELVAQRTNFKRDLFVLNRGD